MSFVYPRLSPSGRKLASGHDIIFEQGQSTGFPGLQPQWRNEDAILYTRQPDGAIMSYRAGGTVVLVAAGGNPPLASANNAYAYQRFDPPRTITSTGAALLGRVSPQLNASGWLSTLSQTDNTLGVSHLTNVQEIVPIPSGHVLWHRWSGLGNTLVFGRADGTMAGVVDWSNPEARRVVELGRGLKPVAVWAGTGGLWVLYHDDSRILFGEWSSLAARAPRGVVIVTGFDGGSAYSHDAAALDARTARIVAHDKDGAPIDVLVALSGPTVDLTPPVIVPPDVLPDVPFTIDPNGRVPDILPWLLADPNMLRPADGRQLLFVGKSDEISADGRAIGEWWDWDAVNIGHLQDASTGHRIYQGQRYSAEEWVALGQPVPWASLYLERNEFKAGARLWLPRDCRSGTVIRYRTDITWASGMDTWRNIEIVIRVDVGFGRYRGKDVRIQGVYEPGGNPEFNYYSERGWPVHSPGGPPWASH